MHYQLQSRQTAGSMCVTVYTQTKKIRYGTFHSPEKMHRVPSDEMHVRICVLVEDVIMSYFQILVCTYIHTYMHDAPLELFRKGISRGRSPIHHRLRKGYRRRSRVATLIHQFASSNRGKAADPASLIGCFSLPGWEYCRSSGLYGKWVAATGGRVSKHNPQPDGHGLSHFLPWTRNRSDAVCSWWAFVDEQTDKVEAACQVGGGWNSKPGTPSHGDFENQP